MLGVNNISRAANLGDSILLADSFSNRLIGLLLHRQLEVGEGLLLTRTKAIHTWGMRFAIDCLFLDDQLRVVQMVPDLGPWRYSPIVKTASLVLELPAGTIARTQTSPGDILQIIDRDSL